MRPTSKLRALEYLIATIEEGGFAGAARKLGVSAPAVHKLVGALEESVSVALLHRDSGRMRLTAEGDIYVSSGREALQHLARAERQIALGRSSATGRVRLALSHVLGSHCIGARLEEFHLRHPKIDLDLVAVNDDTGLDGLAADVLVYLGWTPQQDCIMRRVAQTRMLIVGAPFYWEQHGIPQTPQDLLQHQCITMRLLKRTILDTWHFEKDGEGESVSVDGWIVSDDRDWTMEAVRTGAGITRLPDIVAQRYLASGELVPVLLDWQIAEAPPVIVCYRRAMRDIPRIRALVKFLGELFADLEKSRLPAIASPLRAEPMPPWMSKRQTGRTSARTKTRPVGAG
ncbi:LysR family transcriptional regulator [Hydrogenophaga sp.]|uniref:LysR family transcriptional regulator n=1 Tax=Hydrogenophaga sp. TaxID=1904254 RepID=UPI002717F11E|nr:LysR family transcriptional regulator [Hydrogenophaga sp.]MDO9438244.1 LysR substrate-binding domain-containing protein [Hydrogenophaga sp.]